MGEGGDIMKPESSRAGFSHTERGEEMGNPIKSTDVMDEPETRCEDPLVLASGIAPLGAHGFCKPTQPSGSVMIVGDTPPYAYQAQIKLHPALRPPSWFEAPSSPGLPPPYLLGPVFQQQQFGVELSGTGDGQGFPATRWAVPREHPDRRWKAWNESPTVWCCCRYRNCRWRQQNIPFFCCLHVPAVGSSPNSQCKQALTHLALPSCPLYPLLALPWLRELR